MVHVLNPSDFLSALGAAGVVEGCGTYLSVATVVFQEEPNYLLSPSVLASTPLVPNR